MRNFIAKVDENFYMDRRLESLFIDSRLRETSISSSERARNNDARDAFESDLGRALFSSAARRLHDKTQVIPLTSDDNIHSRLTHSMEVMNIGASLAKDICLNKEFRERYAIDNVYDAYEPMRAILQTVCLVHDIGNPPFGHFGELAISEYFKKFFKSHPDVLGGYTHWSNDFTQYDGNAQGFRVITKLQFIDDLFGLNLTRSCLASYLKYPNTGTADKHNPCISTHKHGVFCADRAYLDKVMNGCDKSGEAYRRHPFVFLVEAADSICYLSMDMEDAYNKRWFNLATLYREWQEFSVHPTAEAAELFSTLENGDTGGSSGRKGFIKFRVNVIKYLVALAVRNYLANFESILEGNYNKELIFDDEGVVAAFLQKFCIAHIYRQKEIQSVELTGWSVINGLLDIYTKLLLSSEPVYMRHGEAMISLSVLRANKMDYLVQEGRIEWSPEERCYVNLSDNTRIEDVDALCDALPIEQLPHYYRLRIIVDFVSSMTDKFAVSHYQKLSGQRI